MEPTALELATNQELIDELLRRYSFRGILAYQEECYKDRPKDDWRWEVRNCDTGTFQEIADNLRGQ